MIPTTPAEWAAIEPNERDEAIDAAAPNGTMTALIAAASRIAERRALREAGEALGHALCGIYARAVAARTDAAIVTNQVMGVEHVAAAVATLADEHKALRAEVAALRECGDLVVVVSRNGPCLGECLFVARMSDPMVVDPGWPSSSVMVRIPGTMLRAALAGVRALREGESDAEVS